MIEHTKPAKNYILVLSIIIFVSSFAIFGSSLGDAPIYTRGEGREALVIQDMILQNNYILPLRNGEDIPSKPPMFHWTSILAAKLFGGLNEFTIRFPSVFYSSLSLAIFFAFVASLSGVQIGFLTMLILGSSFEWIRSSSAARVDMAFSFWLMSGLLCLYLAGSSLNKRRQWFWFLLSGVTIAGAILGKGPTAALIAIAILGIYVLLAGEGSLFLRLKKFPFFPAIVGLSIALFISGIWYYLAFLNQGDSFVTRQLFQENFTRVVAVAGESRGHEKPFYFSLINLLQAFLPWALFFPVLVVSLWKSRRKLLSLTDNGILFCLVWVGLFLLITSISLSKRVVYLLPALPAVSYLLAYQIIQLIDEKVFLKKSQRFAATFLGILAFTLSLVFCNAVYFSFVAGPSQLKLFFSPLILNQTSAIFEQFRLHPFLIGALLISTILVFISAISSWRGALKKSVITGSFAVLIIVIIFKSYFFIVISEALSPNKFAAKVALSVKKDLQIYQYQHDFYATNFYLKRNVPFVGDLKTISDKSFYLLVTSDEQADVAKNFSDAELLLESDNDAANGDDSLMLFFINNNK